MLIDPKVNDYVITKHKGHVGRVIEVNKKWGWFKVDFGRNRIREYSDTSDSLYRMTSELRADFLLKMENAGLTDSWAE